MESPAVATPFEFFSQLHLRELTGLRAHTLAELLAHLAAVPGACIYHHTHHFLQRHQYLSPEPPNDFSYWIAEALGEDRVAERVASIDTLKYTSIRALREKLIATVEEEGRRAPHVLTKQAAHGEEFHFIKAVSVVFPTGLTTTTLAGFMECMEKVTIHSLYYHIFEARLRLERATNDFSCWLSDALGETELASRIARLDPYTHTMEGLRAKIVSMLRRRVYP
jgi:hypothetical protein